MVSFCLKSHGRVLEENFLTSFIASFKGSEKRGKSLRSKERKMEMKEFFLPSPFYGSFLPYVTPKSRTRNFSK